MIVFRPAAMVASRVSTRYAEVDGGGALGSHADGIQCLILRSS